MTRTLVIGLDSADRSLVERWIEEGRLPILGRLRAQGVWGAMTPPPGLGNNAAWPSFFTGASPAEHGHYTYRMTAPGSYRTAAFSPADYRCEPFWNALSRAGLRVAILDVPKAPLCEGLNGVQIADWALHDPVYPQPRSWPLAWSEEIARRFGVDDVEMCDGHDGSPEHLLRIRDGLLSRIRRKTELVVSVLEREEWDFVTAVFADSHCAGHHFWHLHDLAHGDHDAQLREAEGDLLCEVYVALDSAIGEVIDAAGDESRVIVFSAMGIGPNHSGHDLLDEVLRRLEGSPRTAKGRLHRAIGAVKHLVPLRLRRRLGPLVRDQMDNVLLEQDRRNRRCFAEAHNDILGGIRVNVRGREPHGRVEPGSEYEEFCAGLEARLLSLVNLDSGEPAVLRVLRCRSLYPDAPPGELPDLFVEWNKTTPIDRIGGGDIEPVCRARPRHRSGDHTANGFFVASPPGLRCDRGEDGVTVRDIAPTVDAWLGRPDPPRGSSLEPDGEVAS